MGAELPAVPSQAPVYLGPSAWSGGLRRCRKLKCPSESVLCTWPTQRPQSEGSEPARRQSRQNADSGRGDGGSRCPWAVSLRAPVSARPGIRSSATGVRSGLAVPRPCPFRAASQKNKAKHDQNRAPYVGRRAPRKHGAVGVSEDQAHKSRNKSQGS